MMTKEQYYSYYEKNGKVPGSDTKRFLTTVGLREYYRKYCLANEKEIESKDMYQVLHSSKKCYILSNLPDYLARQLKLKASYSIKKLEAAHIIQRSVDINRSNDISNVVLINKYSHYLLDGYLDPIFGKVKLTPAVRLELMRAFKNNDKPLIQKLLEELYNKDQRYEDLL